jgi:hypothetical protein
LFIAASPSCNGRKCQCIVTWNLRDFAAASSFGIQVMTPQTFLNLNDLNPLERKQP